MTTKLYIRENNKWVKYSVYNSCASDERLDEQFDSGEVQTITDSITPFDDFCMAKIVRSDGETDKTSYFIGIDTVSKRGAGYYIHTLELAEPTRLLMGIMIDGRKVTQPLEEDKKKTLKQVLLSFLRTFHLQSTAENSPFELLLDDELEELFTRISPEFHWDGQTQAWEVLCDVGNVVDCIPRLIINDDETAYNVITFDKVNDTTAEYEM